MFKKSVGGYLSKETANNVETCQQPVQKLPNDVLQNIHGFYTDKREAHPTAQLIKQLKFVYNPTYLLKAPPFAFVFHGNE